MELEQLAKKIDTKTHELAQLIEQRDDAIRAALVSGRGPTELARIFGLTRGRIHQIRDNRR